MKQGDRSRRIFLAGISALGAGALMPGCASGPQAGASEIERNRAVALRFKKLQGTKDEHLIEKEVLAPGYRRLRGGMLNLANNARDQGFPSTGRYLRAAIPDRTDVIEEVIAEGDLVGLHFRLTGTHAGNLYGIPVWVDETRPLLQGARLTAWELGRLGIPYRLVTDSSAGALMARGEVDAIVVGADRIARNGDTANKIGTYSVAVLARHHGVPFYVAAPVTTVDLDTPSGDAIPIEERAADEVVAVFGTRVAPAGTPALNLAFDVTPAALVTAIITDKGVHEPPYEASLRRAVEG